MISNFAYNPIYINLPSVFISFKKIIEFFISCPSSYHISGIYNHFSCTVHPKSPKDVPGADSTA
jgi:hypothetical protein